MKKLLVLALASVSFLGLISPIHAADIKFEGDFRVRGIYSDNTKDANDDANDQTAFADGRFRLKTTATAGITSGVVVLDFTNATQDTTACSDPPTGTGCRNGNYRFGAANFGGSYGIVGVRQAYLALDLNMVKLAFGRKPFVLGHSLVLDDTVDAIAAKFMAGPLDVVLANAKLVESTVSGIGGTGSDTDLYIAKAGLKHGDAHALGLFITYLKDRGEVLLGTPLTSPVLVNAGETTLWGLGVTADGTVGPLMLNFEVDLFNGENDDTGTLTTTDLKGMNILAGLGLNVGMADLGVTLLYTTGDEGKAGETNVNGISGNYVLGNILVNDSKNSDREGQCASIGGSRIGSGGRDCVGGFGVTAIKASVGLPGFMTKDCHTEAALIWAQTTEDPAPGVDSDLGIEVDLNHKHKLDDNVAVKVNLGYLMSGDAWKAIGSGDDNQLLGKITLNYMF